MRNIRHTSSLKNIDTEITSAVHINNWHDTLFFNFVNKSNCLGTNKFEHPEQKELGSKFLSQFKTINADCEQGLIAYVIKLKYKSLSMFLFWFMQKLNEDLYRHVLIVSLPN